MGVIKPKQKEMGIPVPSLVTPWVPTGIKEKLIDSMRDNPGVTPAKINKAVDTVFRVLDAGGFDCIANTVVPGVKQFKITPGNVYSIVDGDSFVLVDSNLGSNYEALKEKLVGEGIRPGEIELILLTHPDLDHGGSAAYFSREYGTPVLVTNKTGFDKGERYKDGAVNHLYDYLRDLTGFTNPQHLESASFIEDVPQKSIKLRDGSTIRLKSRLYFSNERSMSLITVAGSPGKTSLL